MNPTTNTPLPIVQQAPITGNATTPSGAVVNATTGTLVSAPPSVNSGISASDINSPTKFNLPPAPTVAFPDLASLPVTLSGDPSPAEQKQQEYTQRYADLSRLIGNRQQVEQDAQSAYGLPQLQLAQKDIEHQIQMHQIQAQRDQETALNSGETLAFAQGEAGRVARNNALNGLELYAAAQHIQGNVGLAQAAVEKAIAARFAPAEAEINYLKTALDINKDNLSREDKKRAATLQIQLDERSRQLKVREDDRREILGFVKTALDNGADPATINRIRNAQTPIDAAVAGGNFIGKETAQSIQEYQFAKRNGYTGTYTGFLDDETSRKKAVALAANPNVVVTASGKPLNDTQATALGYANRVQQSAQTINDLGANFVGFGNTISGSDFFPNTLKSADRQKLEQAERNFVNAVLRRESGAVISPNEFDNAKQQYFPQPGDKPAVIAQKKANRDQVYQNLLISAGNPIVPETAGVTSKNGTSKQTGGKLNDPLGLFN